jgi:HAD superfamily hydrolase (TIGR01509 family)
LAVHKLFSLPAGRASAAFDVDGTLVDSHPFHLAAYNRALGDMATAPVSWEEYVLRCLRANLSFEDILRSRNIFVDRNVLQLLKQKYLDEALASGLQLRPGAADLWLKFRKLGMGIALASAARRASLDAILKHCNLPDLPDAAVCREDIGSRRKPLPDSYILALRRMCGIAECSIAFEDSPAGIEAARAAGLVCIAISTSTFPAGDLHAANVVIESFEQVGVSRQQDQVIIDVSNCA